MPLTSLSLNFETPPVNLKVAIARRSWSASPGVKPAHSMATHMACSWNSGTPSVLPKGQQWLGNPVREKTLCLKRALELFSEIESALRELVGFKLLTILQIERAQVRRVHS